MTGGGSVSVVVASYGCAGTLRELVTQVAEVVGTRLAEIVIVDDRSPDDSWSITKELAGGAHNVRAVRLSRNFGQHVAITAGIACASGDVIVLMDCDLQDSPSEIPRLIGAIEEGADVAIAQRIGSYDTRTRRALANRYARTLGKLTPMRVDSSAGTFSAINRKVADAFLSLGDLDRHYLHLLDWLGFSWVLVPVDRRVRDVGHSAYSIRKLVGHALSGMAFYGRSILRWLVAAGGVMLLLGVLAAITLVTLRFTIGLASGWTSLFVAVVVLGGLNLAAIGVVGLYVGRVYEQSAGRPIYVIDEDTGPIIETSERRR